MRQVYAVFRVLDETPLGAVADLVGVFTEAKAADNIPGPKGKGFVTIPLELNQSIFKPIYLNGGPP